jgi:hypothetical protein
MSSERLYGGPASSSNKSAENIATYAAMAPSQRSCRNLFLEIRPSSPWMIVENQMPKSEVQIVGLVGALEAKYRALRVAEPTG